MEIDEIEDMVLKFLKKYYPFIIFFILIFILHLFMGKFSDDVVYYGQEFNSIPEYFSWKYNMTARIIVDTTLAIVAKQNMVLWRIVDSLIFLFGVYYAIKLVNDKKSSNIDLLGVLLFLMYPLRDMCTAGWMATSINYLWTFSFGVISFLPIVNFYRNEKTSNLMYVICTLCLIFAVNHEQVCVFIFGLNALILLCSILYKKKINKFNIFSIIVSIISFVNIIVNPGTLSRYAWEVPLRYPEFTSFGVIEKLYLGIVPTINILLSNFLIIAVFFIILNIYFSLKTKNDYLKIFAYINIGLILLFTFLQPILILVFPLMANVFAIFQLQALPNLMSREAIIALLISLYFIFTSMILLFKAFDNNIFYPGLFFVGFMSRLMMGFSPTVFFSTTRTAILFYMTLIMLTLMIINRLYDEKWINEKQDNILKAAFILLALFNYLNLFISIV